MSQRALTPVRVAYLCEFPTLLGGERSLLVFLEQARTVGIEPVVVAPGPGPLTRALDEARIAHLDWPPGGRHSAARLAPELRSREVHVVHANSLMTADAAHALCSELSIPGVTHVRDIMRLSPARQTRLAELAGVIAVSGAVRRWLLERGIPEGKLSMIHNAVDGERLRSAASPGSVRSELSLGPGHLLVGCIGQIALRKGQDLFLDAAGLLSPRVPLAHFVLAGARYSQKEESRRYEDSLRARAALPPLAGRTYLLGYRDDIPSVLSDLDVVVVPSRQEPLSRVLLEALALGVPAVATYVGGSAEVLGESEAGRLVPPDDPALLAEAIEALLKSEDLRAEMSRCGPTRARDFLPAAHVGAIRAVYDRVLAGES